MSEWFNSFMLGMDKETVTILGAGVGSIIVSTYFAIKGYRKGTPNVTTTAQAIAQNSCGAPELQNSINSVFARVTSLEEDVSEHYGVVKEMLRLLIILEDRTKR